MLYSGTLKFYFIYTIYHHYSGFVEIGSTLSYVEHREKYVKKGRGKQFVQAVSECDQHIKDPKVYSFDLFVFVLNLTVMVSI